MFTEALKSLLSKYATSTHFPTYYYTLPQAECLNGPFNLIENHRQPFRFVFLLEKQVFCIKPGPSPFMKWKHHNNTDAYTVD